MKYEVLPPHFVYCSQHEHFPVIPGGSTWIHVKLESESCSSLHCLSTLCTVKTDQRPHWMHSKLFSWGGRLFFQNHTWLGQIKMSFWWVVCLEVGPCSGVGWSCSLVSQYCGAAMLHIATWRATLCWSPFLYLLSGTYWLAIKNGI